jgi:Chalcone isomerase-like
MLVTTHFHIHSAFLSHAKSVGRRGAVLFATVALLFVSSVGAQSPASEQKPLDLPAAAQADMPPLKARGGGLLRIFGFQIYNAYLWTPNGAALDRNKPHILDIQYLRNFTAKALAERSIDEMRDQGVGSDAVYPKWLAEMQRVFADVKPGDRLTGVVTAGRTSKFFLNGVLRGEMTDPAFADAFFGIWLHEKTSQPKFRLLLLGSGQ